MSPGLQEPKKGGFEISIATVSPLKNLFGVWSFLVRGLDDGTYPEQFYQYSSGLSQDEVQKRYGMMHSMSDQMTTDLVKQWMLT